MFFVLLPISNLHPQTGRRGADGRGADQLPFSLDSVFAEPQLRVPVQHLVRQRLQLLPHVTQGIPQRYLLSPASQRSLTLLPIYGEFQLHFPSHSPSLLGCINLLHSRKDML